jgi:hypothetical protein
MAEIVVFKLCRNNTRLQALWKRRFCNGCSKVPRMALCCTRQRLVNNYSGLADARNACWSINNLKKNHIYHLWRHISNSWFLLHIHGKLYRKLYILKHVKVYWINYVRSGKYFSQWFIRRLYRWKVPRQSTWIYSWNLSFQDIKGRNTINWFVYFHTKFDFP